MMQFAHIAYTHLAHTRYPEDTLSSPVPLFLAWYFLVGERASQV